MFWTVPIVACEIFVRPRTGMLPAARENSKKGRPQIAALFAVGRYYLALLAEADTDIGKGAIKSNGFGFALINSAVHCTEEEISSIAETDL